MKRTFFKLFEVVSDGVTRVLTLPTGDLLKNNKIVGIEAYNTAGYGTNSVNQKTLASISDCYLKLVDQEGVTMVDGLPLQRINPVNNMGKRFDLEISNINPSDCQIIVSAAAVPASGQIFQVAFYYEKNIC